MQQCAEHVSYQLLNKHTWVGYLLEGIQCSDAGLQAAMGSVRMDNGVDGMRNDFEKAAAHLLPYDPVAKKRATVARNKHSAAQISSVELEEELVKGEVSSTMMPKKASIGRTGVHLQYHMPTKYDILSNEQKDELREWRKQNPLKKKGGDNEVRKGGRSKSSKCQLASVVAKELKKFVRKEEEDKTTSDIQAQIASMVKEAVTSHLASPPTAPTAKIPSTLQSILKKAKNV